MTSRTRTPSDGLVNLALALLACLAVVAGILRLAGSLAAYLTRAPQPTAGVASVLQVWARPLDPATALGSPGLNPIVFWAVVIVLLAVTALVGWAAWRMAVHGRQPTDPRRRPGTAGAGEIARAASAKALQRHAGTLRPSLSRPRADQVGYLLGHARGRQVWSNVEDSVLVLGPPRSGKGLHLVVNAVLDAPGPVITTSTRPDNLTITLRTREQLGPVAVFDPQRLAPGLPAGLRWSPIRGCEDPLTAMIRAAGLASSTGLGAGGVDNGGFWEGKTRTAIQALLHAAALDQRTPATLYQWTLNPALAADAARILHAHPDAAHGWGDALEAMITADPRTRDSIWHGVSMACAALADPRVLDAVSPAEGDAFDPTAFLRDNGTLYLLATGAGAGASAALVAAFIEDLIETARRLAANSSGARLDPPLLLALDEIGNLAPLPSLPILMAEGGGTGITTMPVLQSMAQARHRWGEHAATAIWDAAIVKIILGGGSHSRDLTELCTLLGERDEPTVSVTRDSHGSRSTQHATRRVPVMPPEVLRTLPFGTAVILLRAIRPIIATLRPWIDRPDATALQQHKRGIEALLSSNEPGPADQATA